MEDNNVSLSSQRSTGTGSLPLSQSSPQQSDMHASLKKSKKRKHKQYDALEHTMTSLVEQISSLASNQQWIMQQFTARQAAPSEPGQQAFPQSDTERRAPQSGTKHQAPPLMPPVGELLRQLPLEVADDNVDFLSVMASDSLDVGYGADRALSPPHSDLSSDQGSSLLSQEIPSAFSGEEFFALMSRAAKRLKVEMPTMPETQPSLFDRRKEPMNRPCALPALPDFVKEMTTVWEHPEAATPPMRQWARFADIHGANEVGFGIYPAMDDSIAALVLPPTALAGKDPVCPNKQCRTTDKWLKRSFYNTAFQARLMNTTSVLTLYQMELIEDLSAAPAQEVIEELKRVSEILVHLAKGAAHSSGRSIASLWMARRHLWLAQSKLPEQDRNMLMKLPITPGFTFGPGTVDMLRRAKESRESRKEWEQLMPKPPPPKRQRSDWKYEGSPNVPLARDRPHMQSNVRGQPTQASSFPSRRPGNPSRHSRPRRHDGHRSRATPPATASQPSS